MRGSLVSIAMRRQRGEGDGVRCRSQTYIPPPLLAKPRVFAGPFRVGPWPEGLARVMSMPLTLCSFLLLVSARHVAVFLIAYELDSESRTTQQEIGARSTLQIGRARTALARCSARPWLWPSPSNFELRTSSRPQLFIRRCACQRAHASKL